VVCGSELATPTLQDALTTLRFHQKPLPGTFDTALLDDIEREAARRMLALVAPEDAAGWSPFPHVSVLLAKASLPGSSLGAQLEPSCLLSPAIGSSSDHQCARALVAGKPGALRLGVGRLVAEIVQRMVVSTSGWCTPTYTCRLHGVFYAACCLADALHL
jgi:hypothetical protein